MSRKKKILVAMSGGVDSSLAAAILKEEGHEVWGVSLRVYDPGRCQEGEGKTCCSARDIRDARQVAASLGIPFSTWDVRREFAALVIQPFVREYLRGRTPNPCVLCNSRIKFRLLLKKALEMGAEHLATGHYARMERRNGRYLLRRGLDPGKDQSYYLFATERSALPYLLFPLGNLRKPEVRRRAREMGVTVAEKRESQEICFVPDNDYVSFLSGQLPAGAPRSGPIVNLAGKQLGTHRGLMRYTVGQRRGLGLSTGLPLYVLRLEPESNTVVVGGAAELGGRVFEVSGTNWLEDAPRETIRAEVQIRSRHLPASAVIRPAGRHIWEVVFTTPQKALTPGQAAVFYRGGTVCGGGWIEKVLEG